MLYRWRKNKQGCEFQVIEKLPPRGNEACWRVRFSATGSELEVTTSQIRKETFADPLHYGYMDGQLNSYARIGEPSKLRTAARVRWRKLAERCYDPNHNMYEYYGAIGIRFCPRWTSFAGFWEDLPWLPGFELFAEKSTKAALILDYWNSGNAWEYSPENCGFRDWKEHGRRSLTRYAHNRATPKSETSWADARQSQ